MPRLPLGDPHRGEGLPLLHERGAAVRLKSPIPYAWLLPHGWTDAVVAFALGYGLYSLANQVSYLLVDVLAQYVVEQPTFVPGGVDERLESFAGYGPQVLNFRIGDAVFIYGVVLVQALALLFVALAAYGLWRLRLRRLQECPHCLSRVPRGATVCRECSLDVAT